MTQQEKVVYLYGCDREFRPIMIVDVKKLAKSSLKIFKKALIKLLLIC